MAAHEAELLALRKERREAVSLWRQSTGTALDKPEEDRDRSIRVDVFGRLRGACRRTSCAMWRRDVNSMRNWSDITVLQCEARAN